MQNLNFNIDSVIFIGFLAINLAVGLFYGRGIRSIKVYAIGDRNFSTATIAATIVATWVSGGAFALYMSETYTQGLHFIMCIFADAGSFLIVAYILAPRMAEFLGKLSVAESMGDLYGTSIRIITALAGFIGTIGALAIQFKVSSTILEYLFNMSTVYATLASSVVVILYSTFGGLKSVTFTDIIQFFTFGTLIPILGLIIWGALDNPYSVIDNVTQSPLFDYKQVFNLHNPKFLSSFTLFLYFLIPGLSPATFQRITMAKNINQVRKAFILAAFILLLIELLIAWISILLFSKDATINPNNLINYIIDNYSYVGLKGFIVTGIMAMIMSTADSYINSAAVLFAHDFCKPLGIATEKNELFLSRIFSVLLGIFAITFTFVADSLLNLFLLGYSFYMIVVTIPFIMAILGFRTSTKVVLIGMAAGVITVLIWPWFDRPDIDSVIPGMLSNLIFFIGSHYLLCQPGGWIGIKDDSPLRALRIERKRKILNFIISIKEFSFLTFCKNNSPKQDYTYSVLGLFCVISVFSTMYSIPKEIQQQNVQLLEFIYHTILFSSTILLTFPVWPPTFKKEKFIIFAWNLMLPYLLIFAPTILIIISNFGQFQLMIFLINIVVFFLLMRWQITLFMICCTMFLSVQFYKWYMGVENINAAINIGLQFKVMYALLLVSSVLITFLKPKQEYQELTEQKNSHLNGRITNQEKQLQEALALRSEFIRNVSHEYHAPMTGIMSNAEILSEVYDKLTDVQRKQAINNIYASSVKLKRFDDNITTLARLSQKVHDFNLVQFDFSELLYERIELCRKLYEEDKEAREFILDIDNNIEIKGDKKLLTHVLDNLIINAITYCKEGKITITLKQDEAGVHFTVADEGIGIPPHELYDIFEPFTVSSRTRSPAGGRGVGLALCKRVIEVHGGKIEAESGGIKGAVLKFILPKQ